MASGVDCRLLTESVARARVSDRLWIDFVTGAIRGRSFEQSLIDAGSNEAARFWGQVKRLTEVGVGALYKRGAFRACKHPFDFRSDNAEYQLGSGGEWRILRDGHLYKTDPNKIDEPTAWTEPTPFDALDVAEQMTITETADEATMLGRCRRFTGTAYGLASRCLKSGRPANHWPSRCSSMAKRCCARSISTSPARGTVTAPR